MGPISSKSPVMKENSKMSLHSKKPSFNEKTLMGFGEALNNIDIGMISGKNNNKSFLLGNRNSSLEEQDIFDLKRLK